MLRKSLYRNLVFIIVLLFTLQVTITASGQEGGGFSETFDDATLPGWEHSQDVLVTEGVLRINPENVAFRMGTFANPDLTVRFRITPPGGIEVVYHATDQGAYHLRLNAEGGNISLTLDKDAGGTFTTLASGPVSNFVSGDWNTLHIVLRDGQHQVSLNDVLLITANDTDLLRAGSIGFFVHGENPADFDDLIVTTSEVAAGTPQGELAPVEQVTAQQQEPPTQQEPAAQQGETLPAASVLTTPLVTPQPGASTRGILEELFISGANPLDIPTFLINLGLAALLSFILGRVYIYWGASLSNRRKFAANFMLMSVTTTFIILVVRSSVALSLGLVGALSIVRFRAAIKEPEELAYLFLAIGLGIGLGDNQRLVTFLAFAVAIIVLGLMKVLRRSQADVNMHLNISSQSGEKPELAQVMAALDPYCSKIKLLRFDETDKLLEMSFLVELRSVSDLSQARAALQQLSPQVGITFLDNKGIW